jgi:hypothetical protein
VAQSPELQAVVAEQRRVRAAIDAAAGPAPAPLRTRVEGALRPQRGRRARIVLMGALATTAAALALVVLLVGGTPAGPSLSQAASLGAMPATAPAPEGYDATPELLNVAIGGVRFPAWHEAFGWRAAGTRSDRVAGRAATTVFYEKGGRSIGYTIVAGAPLDVPAGARRATHRGLALHTLAADGRTIVTWERMGHTCILSGADVPAARMIELAGWTAGGTVLY